MALAGHPHAHFVNSSISQRNGGIVVVEHLIDCLALLQPCSSPMLPDDRGNVGGYTDQPFMPDLQRLMAKFETFVKNLPKLLHVTVCFTGNIGKVERDYALVDRGLSLGLYGFPALRMVANSTLHLVPTPSGSFQLGTVLAFAFTVSNPPGLHRFALRSQGLRTAQHRFSSTVHSIYGFHRDSARPCQASGSYDTCFWTISSISNLC